MNRFDRSRASTMDTENKQEIKRSGVQVVGQFQLTTEKTETTEAKNLMKLRYLR
jgi:hypothetical protein